MMMMIGMGAEAKMVSGQFRLSGKDSEIILTSFAISSPMGGTFGINLTTGDIMYEEERYLRLHLFRDVEWPKFQKALTCSDKIVMAKQVHSISFDYKNGQWNTKLIEGKIVNTDDRKDMKSKTYRPHCKYYLFCFVYICGVYISSSCCSVCIGRS